MRYKCIVWGIGNDYERIINQLLFEISKGNIEVLALISRPQDMVGKTLDGFPLILKEELEDIQFDYLMISSTRYYKEICTQAKEIGIDEDKIINANVMELPLFDFNRYISLIKNKITILADDCWGGYVYHCLFMKFYSPFINCYLKPDSFLKFALTPEYYLKEPLQMERESSIRGNIYPVGSLGTGDNKVFIEFFHSLNFTEAKVFWDRRVKRINCNNFFVKFGIDASDPKREEYLERFADITEKKICFYSGETEVSEVLYLNRFEKFVQSGSRVDTIKYNDYARKLEWITKSINLLKLLNGEKDFLRE